MPRTSEWVDLQRPRRSPNDIHYNEKLIMHATIYSLVPRQKKIVTQYTET